MFNSKKFAKLVLRFKLQCFNKIFKIYFKYFKYFNISYIRFYILIHANNKSKWFLYCNLFKNIEDKLNFRHKKKEEMSCLKSSDRKNKKIDKKDLFEQIWIFYYFIIFYYNRFK